jgi:hypothetical protein
MLARVDRRPTTDDAGARVRLCRGADASEKTTDDILRWFFGSRAGAAAGVAGAGHQRRSPAVEPTFGARLIGASDRVRSTVSVFLPAIELQYHG